MPHFPHHRGKGSRGFTLIEVLAAILLTGIVMSGAVAFQINLGHATSTAADVTREGRQAMGVLDLVARDLQSAYLLSKPEDLDPLEHPWVFLAEDRSAGQGAERLKFVSRGLRSRSTQQHTGDLGMLAYVLVGNDEGDGFSLMRWSQPGLPEGLDRSFPDPNDPGVFVVAEDLQEFGLRFLNEEGAWTEDWDSSLIGDSSQLPIAAEIRLTMLDLDDPDGEKEPFVYTRRVVLPVRPIDLAALLQGPDADEDGGPGGGEDGEDDEDEDGGGGSDSAEAARIQACLQANRDTIIAQLGEDGYQQVLAVSADASPEQVEATLQSYGLSCP